MFDTLEKMLIDYKWKINKHNKTTVMRKGQFSLNVGKTAHWAKPGKPILPSVLMRENKSQIYNECKRLFPEHEFDCVMINKNFKCPPHRDKNNIGDSIIIGLGNYNGGDLVVEGKGHCLLYSPFVFNGSQQEHWVEDWTGDRYTIVLCKSKFKSMLGSAPPKTDENETDVAPQIGPHP